MENDATENAELHLLYIFIVYPIIGVMSTKINKKHSNKYKKIFETRASPKLLQNTNEIISCIYPKR